MTDEYFMKRALRLARRGEAFVTPNPMVGAVIVKDGKIIGEGYHACYGDCHAEVNAINAASSSIAGATFYVTLEPCCHQGKTPPCVNSILAAKPSRVVVGSVDPNPLVAGNGIRMLAKHGIKITVGILERECRIINERFFKFMETGVPFVTLKFAQSLDGRLATASGHSQWISSIPSRRFAHELRAAHDAVLVGVGTVQEDDPELTVRHVRGRQPLRIVLDAKLSIPLDSRILKDQELTKTILVTSTRASGRRHDTLIQRGIEVITVKETSRGILDLRELLVLLGKRGITSLLVEGGAKVITSFFRARLADRLVVIIAPKIIGRGLESVGDLGTKRMEDALALKDWKVRR
ncbi:MAG: bifunctional diaminohydroxyphosphoribosylaminopyrimidine deaminase/5-amino-6-(5-phosphoribosylamino)uracil reductase RibD, partial [Smithellaceae bacterium]|nr:bifunctional diaminohydroxyphosphoribosylaminopyrimidine deaminase/5-amino-6-(5-phosphoribosylamino)uracil reductase RibD [Smithellaceae bacterium]